MPKQTPPRGSRRSRPYPDPKSRPTMSTTTMNSMRTPAAAVTTNRPTPAWDNPSSPRSMRPPLSTFDRRLSSSERGVPQSPGTPATPSSQSGPWSAHDDEVLLSARAQGLGWNQIQRENFQVKTPNACRKRFERLVQKRKGAEWEGERVEKVAKVYSQMRSDIWRPLAEATGESWEDVERLCLERPRHLLPATTQSSVRRHSPDNESRGSHDSHDEEKLRINNLLG